MKVRVGFVELELWLRKHALFMMAFSELRVRYDILFSSKVDHSLSRPKDWVMCKGRVYS